MLLAHTVCIPGCFYTEAVSGQLHLINEQIPLDQAANSEPDPLRRSLLHLVPEVLLFAREVPRMEAGGSYRGYIDLKRMGLTFVLVASQRAAFEPYQWWFPLAGTVEYKSFFNLEAAEAEAQELEAAGYDVFIGRSRAYSTLGYLRDPVTNSMLSDGVAGLTEVLLHELAHRRLYIPGQTAFNEQLASFVAREAGQRFVSLPRFSHTGLRERWEDRLARIEAITGLVERTTAELSDLYASDLDDGEKLRRREPILARLTEEFRALRGAAPRVLPDGERISPYEEVVNNARLLQYARYDSEDPTFERLFAECGRSWICFWEAVAEYAASDPWQEDEAAP